MEICQNQFSPSTWEGDELAALKGQLSQLISPFVENRPFQVYMTVNGESINIVQEFADQSMFLWQTILSHLTERYWKFQVRSKLLN